MQKVVAIASVGSAAAGGKLALTWEDCGSSSTHGKTDDIQPTEIAIGADTQIVGTGATDKQIDSGSFAMKLTAGAGIIKETYTGKICEAKTFNMPLGLGTVSWGGMDCPVPVGPSTVKIGVHMAGALPASMAKADLALTALDQDGEQALCVNTHLAKEVSDEQGNCDGAACPAICECAFSKCSSAVDACLGDATCAAAQSCVLGCACGDTACAAGCAVTAGPKAAAVLTCLTGSCGGDSKWENFKAEYGKYYNGDEEEAKRHEIFNANMEFISEENAKGHSYMLGVGPFADLTAEEFKATRLGYKKSESDAPVLDTHSWQGEELADSLDWTTKGAVTDVKDQGQCGSCWAFSTTGALESGYELATGQLVSLSEQQYVDCDGFPNLGCSGGQMSSALKWAEKNDICTEDSYPYTAKGGIFSSCKSQGCTVGLKAGSVTGVKNLNNCKDEDLKSALQGQPISIAIEADQNIFQHYTSGVITGKCGTNTDHGVLLVGYGTDAGTAYWKVKNSWGTSWGDNGYVRLAQGMNQCGINSGPNYPVFSASVSV